MLFFFKDTINLLLKEKKKNTKKKKREKPLLKNKFRIYLNQQELNLKFSTLDRCATVRFVGTKLKKIF
jgi:hypothetical protein